MSVTIDSLDIQIRSSAGSAAANIEKLASSLESLQKHSKLTTVSNQLTKLSVALNQLQVNSSTIGTIKGLAGAMKSMSAIQKSSGLNSTINSLKKLPEVVNALDPATVKAFSAAMNELSDGLAPLAKKIDTISKGFSKLPSQVSKCVTAVKRLDSANKSGAKSAEAHGEALNNQSINFLAAYENLQNVLSIVHGIQAGFAALLDDAIQWDGIQFRFGRAFGEDADMVLEYAQKVSDELKINMQQFMQYSSLYGSLLSGFGMAQEQVTTISIGLTELSYDIWAAYNDRYRTLEDASEAVRSAITGEIEPIRNAGIALTEASMQEYLDSLGMAHISMEKLTEAQKSEVRYAAMVNSAMNQGIVGTYAREMQTAEGAVRTLTQQLKTLGQAIGSLFIPILQAVLPWISAFVSLLTDGIKAIAAFFGIKFQEIKWSDPSGMKQTADSMGQTAQGADATAGAMKDAAKSAKAMKDYTMGFDELNIIDPPSADSAGAGGAGGAGAGGIGAGESLGLDLDTLWDDAVFASASKQIDEIKAKIKSFFDDNKVQFALASAMLATFVANKAWKKLDELFDISKKVKGIPAMFHKSWFANFTSGLKMLKNGHISFKEFLAGITGGMKTQNFMASAADLVLRLGNALKTGLTKLPSLLLNAVRAIPGWGWIIAAIAGLIALAVADYDFTDIGYKIGHALGSALKSVGKWLGSAGEWIVGVGRSILDGINAAWLWVKDEFDIQNVVELIAVMFNPVAWVTKILPKMIEIGAEVLPGLWEGIQNGWNNFWSNIEEFISGFIQGFKDGLGIASPSTVFAEIGGYIIEGLLDGIALKWEDLKKWFNENIAPKFTKEFWVGKWENVRKGAEDKLTEIKKGITDKVDEITSWFSTNVAPMLTIDYWKEKFDGMRQGIAEKLAEVKRSITDKWDEIKLWFNNNIAPKLTLNFWAGKFANIKDALTQAIKGGVNGAIDILNKFIDWVNDHLKIEIPETKFGNKVIFPGITITGFTIPNIPRFEQGGFIEDGLFTMNHGEIAGKFNNGKSVVANNQQIVEGIATGVYEAVVAAMNATNGGQNQNINVYLDGRQITAAVEKRQSERGMQLIGNQLGFA